MTQEQIDKLNDYQKFTPTTAIYPKEVNNFDLAYLFLGLMDEGQELVEKIHIFNDYYYENNKNLSIESKMLVLNFQKQKPVTEGISEEILSFINNNETKNYLLDIKKETGDVLWYASNILNLFNVSLSDFIEYFLAYPRNIEVKTLGVYGSIKKYYRDGSDINIELLQNSIIEILAASLFSAYLENTSIESYLLEAIEMNQSKLTSRKERNVLSGSGDNR